MGSENELVDWKRAKRFAILAARMGLRPDVVFLKSVEGGWYEHTIDCETYIQARKQDAQNFRKIYLD